MSLPSPVTTTDFYLAAILAKLEEIRIGLIDVETELQRINKSAAIQKPTVQIDTNKLTNAIGDRVEKAVLTAAKRSRGGS